MTEESDKSGLARRMQLRQVNQTLEKAASTTKKLQAAHVETLVGYLRDKGHIICVSDDMQLAGQLRELVAGTLKMPASCASFHSRPDTVGRALRAAVDGGKAPLLIIDQTVQGRDMTFPLKILKAAYPEAKTLTVAQDVDKNRLVLLHESGADSMLVRPLDSAAMLEKMAAVIKPNEQAERSLEMTRALLAKGEHMAALQAAAASVTQTGNSPAALMLLGDVFKAMREWDKAADAYSRASGSSPVYIEPLRRLAELYEEKGDLARRLEYLEKMDELSPLNLERKIMIGELALRLKKGDKAKKIFDQAMKLSHRQARESMAAVAYRVADIYNATDPETAASFLEKGLEARKDFWGREDLATFNKLGLILRRAGKWREAADAYQKAMTVAPNDETLHYNLAMAYFEGKEIELARASALKALGINPDLPRKSARVAANLAATFMSASDRVHAQSLAKIALEQEPENAQALEILERLDEKRE